MRLNKLAASAIASVVLLGGVGQLAANAQPVSANAEEAPTLKAELVNINFKRHSRRSFKRHGRRSFRHHGRRSFRHHGRRNFRRNAIGNDKRYLKFDKAFSTGNNRDEKIIRVRLF
ncbi:MAG: hypothetical protein QNJ51_23085 [Calothrix sp. MO_167.B12]|nr:hypothetical protein [Calothrix sp. MO_167.B12]